MKTQKKLFAGVIVTCMLCLCVAWMAADVSVVFAADSLEYGEEIDKQIEYMLNTAKQVREKVLESDAIPPEITGLPTELVVKKGETLSYKRGVSVQDNSGAELKLVIDNSGVDLSKEGTYTVIYSATDLSGNTTVAEVPIVVIEGDPVAPEVVYELADALMDELLTDDMALQDQVFTLWDWCRTKIKYSYSSDKRTVYEAAYEGFHDRKGDCYIYYACMEVFLDRLGVENMRVARVGGVSRHWWNLVNLGDGWYHLDASPRQKGDPYKCFLQTDEQIAQYTLYYEMVNPGHPNYYSFDESLYPERATTIIYDGKMNPLPVVTE